MSKGGAGLSAGRGRAVDRRRWRQRRRQQLLQLQAQPISAHRVQDSATAPASVQPLVQAGGDNGTRWPPPPSSYAHECAPGATSPGLYAKPLTARVSSGNTARGTATISQP